MSVEGVRSWLGFGGPRSARQPARMREVAGWLAVLSLGFLAAVRVGLNLPVTVPVADLYPIASAVATVAPPLGLLGIAVATERPAIQVSLTFAAVFGLLTVVARPALLPATVAVMAAIGLVTVTQVGRRWYRAPETGSRPRLVTDRRPDEIATDVVAVGLAVGAVISLAAGLGVAPAALRPLGSKVMLLSVAALPVFVDWDWNALLVGVGAAGAVAAFGLAEPFVTGAVSLVVGGIVGTSLPLLLVATAGGVTVLWASVRDGHLTIALAAGALLVAGVPATMPRGLAVLTAITLLLAPQR